jgi:transcriptional regulator with XRE-family HTH domain
MIDSELLPRVARKIKTLRSNKNLTLAELSKHSNVSKGLLSKIENSRTTPSLPVFLGIVNALGVSLRDFFEGMDLLQDRDYLLVKKEAQHIIKKEGTEGITHRFLMAQGISGNSIEIAVVTIGAAARNVTTTTRGFELNYIISGECDFQLNEEVIRLEEGDALYFDGAKPHLPVNPGSSPLVLLVIYFLK